MNDLKQPTLEGGVYSYFTMTQTTRLLYDVCCQFLAHLSTPQVSIKQWRILIHCQVYLFLWQTSLSAVSQAFLTLFSHEVN